MFPVLAITFWVGPLSAQTFTGNLTGRVLDQQDALVSGAQVTLTNTATGEVRRLLTSDQGRYTFSQLMPSTYSMRVVMAGFKEMVRSGIEIGTNRTVELDVQLAVGALTEAVEVSAAASLVDTQTANQSTALNTQMVKDLPLVIRNPLDLVHATAGVVSTQTWQAQNVRDDNSTRWAMNGGRENATAVLIDGVPGKNPDWGGLIAAPGVDSVQEVQIIKNTYEAQYGRTGGGVINVTTRGGSEKYHGSAFEYLRRNTFDANTFWNNLYNRPKAAANRNQFGGNFSGPILRAKRLYGFFGYEGLREKTPNSRLVSVPTDLQRQGDFSQTFNANGSLQAIYDPTTTRQLPNGSYLRDAFPGNKIPSQRFDPVAAKIMGLFPKATQPGDSVTGLLNYYKSAETDVMSNRWDLRFDWARSEKHTMYYRVTKVNQYNHPPVYYDAPIETGNDQDTPHYHMTFGNTFVISPTMVLNILAGAAHGLETQLPKQIGYDFSQLGFPGNLTPEFDLPAPPNFAASNYTGLGNNRYLAITRNVYNLQVNLTKEKGSHSIKFGLSTEYQQINDTDVYSPSFSFSNVATLGPDPDSRTGLTGNSLASMLLGAGSGGTWNKYIYPAITEPYWAGYVQDSWKVTPRLTLNYGLRYEAQLGRTERYNRGNYFDFNAINPIGAKAGLPNLKGGMQFLGPDERSWWDTPKKDFAPRFGIAYKLSEKLVVRSGYGMFFTRSSTSAPTTGIQGYSASTPWVTSLDGGRTIADPLKNPFPTGIQKPTGSQLGLLTRVGDSVSTYQRNRPDGYMQQYSFDLQYQPDKDTMAEIGYAGSQGRKLLFGYGFQMNQIPDAALALGPALLEQVPNPFYGLISTGTLAAKTVQRGQLLRPYPQFTGVTLSDNPGASSSFNALSAKITRQFSNGLTLIGSYQFSKAIDNASEDISWAYGDGARNFNNLSLERSISGHDVPHSLALAYIYQMPFGKGKPFGANWNRVVDTILGGWRLAGMFKMDSGLPTRFSASNNTYSFGGSQMPNVANRANVNIDSRSRQRWFNTSQFSQPPAYTFGNTPRFMGEVRSSRVNNMDMALVKEVKITERVKGQVRAETFNAFNRNRFGKPDASVTSQTFGQVTGSVNQPRWFQFGFRVDF